MSKYDNITTAADLVTEVMMHGMSTLTEDIVRAQDILGRSAVEEIAYLAEGGEKDCYGNPKNSRVQPTLFQIVFTCWDRDRAAALYNEHVTRYPAQLKEAQGELRSERQDHADTKNRLEHEKLMLRHSVAEADSLQESCHGLQDAYEAAKLEIDRLKARLYDLMTAGADPGHDERRSLP